MALIFTLLGIYPKEMNTGSQRDIFTVVFTVVLFKMARDRQPSVHQWMDEENLGEDRERESRRVARAEKEEEKIRQCGSKDADLEL